MRRAFAQFTMMNKFYPCAEGRLVQFMDFAAKMTVLIALNLSPAHASPGANLAVEGIDAPDISDSTRYNPLLFSARLCGKIETSDPLDLPAAKIYRMNGAGGVLLQQRVYEESRVKDGYQFCSQFIDMAPEPRDSHRVFSVEYKYVLEKMSVPFTIVLYVNPVFESPKGKDLSRIPAEDLARFNSRKEIIPDPRAIPQASTHQ